ncbi:MAG TPA: glycosyltransferase [Pyrinomonadaceae bacterium]|nr:glycosyltransferase [Pyrinomonadaceae bacterium]
MKPLALVIPWFGPDLPGGAEQQAFQITTRLAARGHQVEVITTTNLSFESDWSTNRYASGVTEEFGLTVRRFAVEERAVEKFDRVNAKLLSNACKPLRRGLSPVSLEDTETFVHENIKSKALLEFLSANKESYHAFIFLPYMFSTTTLGLPIVARRAWLQPCLHDEPQAYFPQTAALFRRSRGILFNSRGEFELALRLYGPGIHTRSTVIGEGIERSEYEADVLRKALPAGLRDIRYLLYLGRRDCSKNVHVLVEAFSDFKMSQPHSKLKLVLAGTGTESFATSESISEMGFVSGQLKASLLAHCLALVQPSANESFSRVLMEAWAAGRPAAVNGECLATATAVNEARAGWTPTTSQEWLSLFELLETETDDALNRLGQRGREYAHAHADWDSVIARYESVLQLHRQPGSHKAVVRSRTLESIHQLLPDLVFGDAISNQAIAIRNEIRDLGYSSDIFCKRRADQLVGEALLLDEARPDSDSALIYHYGIGSDVTAVARAHEGPNALVYHNVTPATYFARYRPSFSWMLELGRINLKRLAECFPVSVGDSAYNAGELTTCGFKSPGVLPIIINPDRWNIEGDSEVLARLQNRRTNVLFVGRIAPNKKQDRLIEAFAHFRKLDSSARLILAGESRSFDPYFQYVVERCRELNLSAHVEFTGQISESELLAYYQTAHLYWSASEHEGFGAPLVEAMWFDVPVLALGETAVCETLGNAGVLYGNDEPLEQVAERAFKLVHDRMHRREVIEKQRVRRCDFMPEAVAPRINELCEMLEAVNQETDVSVSRGSTRSRELSQ